MLCNCCQSHLQGDVEKDLGWKPIPLFDRDHAEEVASMQVKLKVLLNKLQCNMNGSMSLN